MINHFLVLAKRTLLRNSLFSLVNVISLAVGLSVCYYSALFVYNEFNYEAVYSKSERIVRLTMHIKSNRYDMKWARQDRNYMNALPSEIPEIKNLVRFQNYYPRNVVIGDNAFKVNHGYSTDANVFNVFDFLLIEGNPGKALEKPNSVVLSESTARKLFGNNTAYGETIAIVNDTGTRKEVYQVTGIMEDVPSNTHLPVNMLTSFSGPEERIGWAYTYLLLQPRVDYKQVQKKINQYVNRKGGEDAAIASFPLQPIESIHLNSSLAREIQPNSSKSRVLLIGIAGLIILILCIINFLNLTTAQSLGKVQEMGIRKVMGATRKNLIGYFFTESLMLCLLVGVLGLVTIIILSSEFKLFNSIAVPLQKLWPLAFMMITGIALAATYYPALMLSSKNILVAMKSKEGSLRGKQLVKNGLVAFQLIICVMLVSAALITRNQYNYLVSKDLGINY